MVPGLQRIDEVTWELPASHRADMRVPVRIVADDALLASALRDRCLEQLVNVATLPGVVRHVIAMPVMRSGLRSGIDSIRIRTGAI